jgi:pimeloyl-ACP methyl ester carboxylesterase
MNNCRSADGTTISFLREGSGPSLVLVHAAMSDHRYWRGALPALASGFTVHAMDRRGRGESDPFREDHTIERDYEDVLAVVAAANPPVHLLGHSSGARYAMHAALRVPELASLMLYEPALFRPIPSPILADLAEGESRQDRDALLTIFLRDILHLTDQDLIRRRETSLWTYWLEQALTLPPEMRSLGGYRFDPQEFADVSAPALLLLGSESRPPMKQGVEEVAAALANSRIAILRGQGHAAITEAPELVVEQVDKFVASLP